MPIFVELDKLQCSAKPINPAWLAERGSSKQQQAMANGTFVEKQPDPLNS